MNRPSFLLAALVAALALFLPSCVGAGANQVVAYSSFEGNADVRAGLDGYVFAMGEGYVSAGVYSPQIGIPYTVPFVLERGTWAEFEKFKLMRSGEIGVDPIPWRAVAMYPPAPAGQPTELEKVLERLGYEPANVPLEGPPTEEPPAPTEEPVTP